MNKQGWLVQVMSHSHINLKGLTTEKRLLCEPGESARTDWEEKQEEAH